MKTISVQLWSVRNKMAEDVRGTLKTLANMGFKAVEPAGFYDMPPKDFIAFCNDLGLATPSAHSPWAVIGDELEKNIEIALSIGLKRMACGGGPQNFETIDAIKEFADAVNNMHEKVKAAGMTMFQHNHAFEFERLDGRLKYDIYRDLVSPEIMLELDLYWSANFGAEDPAEMVRHYLPYVELAHVKDGSFVQGEPNVALGEGKMDIPAALAALPERADVLVIEFDSCAGDIFTEVQKSREFLLEIGKGEYR